MASNPIPPDQSSWSVYGKLADLNNQYLWGVLEDAPVVGAVGRLVDQKGHRTLLASGLNTPPANVGPRSTPNYANLAKQAVYPLPGGGQVF